MSGTLHADSDGKHFGDDGQMGGGGGSGGKFAAAVALFQARAEQAAVGAQTATVANPAPMASPATNTKPTKKLPGCLPRADIAKFLSNKHDIELRTAYMVLNAIASIAEKELKTVGKFTFPKVLKMKMVRIPARPSRVRRVCGQDFECAAHPEMMIAKAYAAETLKMNVNA